MSLLDLSGAGDYSAESARHASLGTGVRFVVLRPDVLVGQMRINLRRRYAGMSKELLNVPERSPSTEQMRREAVPQRVGRNLPVEAGTLCSSL